MTDLKSQASALLAKIPDLSSSVTWDAPEVTPGPQVLRVSYTYGPSETVNQCVGCGMTFSTNGHTCAADSEGK